MTCARSQAALFNGFCPVVNSRTCCSRGRLDREGVKGPLCESREGVLDNTYLRLLRSLDARDTERLQRILRECFRNQAMTVIVEQPHPATGTPAHSFIQALQTWTCLHFIEE